MTAVVNIYTEDKTCMSMEEIEKESVIQNRIRQGCPGSTVLFKIITLITLTKVS